MANFINGELYGRPASVPWAVKFPQEIYELPVGKQREILALAQSNGGESAGLEQIVTAVSSSPDWRETLGAFLTPRHPSQIYEGLLEGVLLFAMLWILRTRVRTANGVITGAFFVGYAILRSIGEFFRAPEDGYVGFLTAGQFLSVFTFLIGIGFWIAAKLRPSYPPAER
jgi:phosphatidylglycerol:prolipoprotein diacylglycerol transferase